jgi:hypothetical protein
MYIFQSLHVSAASSYHTDLNIPVPDPVLFYNNDTAEVKSYQICIDRQVE